MASLVGRQEFLRSEMAGLLRKELESMDSDPGYNTVMRYTLVTTKESQFVEKHMAYMSNHLRMDHWQYIRNLKLMTRLR